MQVRYIPLRTWRLRPIPPSYLFYSVKKLLRYSIVINSCQSLVQSWNIISKCVIFSVAVTIETTWNLPSDFWPIKGQSHGWTDYIYSPGLDIFSSFLIALFKHATYWAFLYRFGEFFLILKSFSIILGPWHCRPKIPGDGPFSGRHTLQKVNNKISVWRVKNNSQ